MASPPQLLNDDGSASMATAFLMSHHGLRRDVARFAIALRELAAGDRSRTVALHEEWQSYRNTLHGHHEVEDLRIFPDLKSRYPSLVPVIEQLSSEHRRIDPLLEQGDRAFAGLASEPAAAASVVSQLSGLLDQHLATEEAHVVPHLREAKQFPPPTTDAEVEMYAQGFAWSSHGVAPQVLERIQVMLPEILGSKLPAARVTFQKRCDRVWGPTPSGASLTSIPDWLAGS